MKCCSSSAQLHTTRSLKLRDEMAWAVAEEHKHGQELLGLFGIIVQTVHKEFEASLWAELTDEGPEFGQKIIQVCQTCRKTGDTATQWFLTIVRVRDSKSF